jgi:hypothetical protein
MNGRVTLVLLLLAVSTVAQEKHVVVVASSTTKTTYREADAKPTLMETSCLGDVSAFGIFKGFSANCNTTAIPPPEAFREHHYYDNYTVLQSDVKAYLVYCSRKWPWERCPSLVPGDNFTIDGEYDNNVTLVRTEGRKSQKMELVQVVSLQSSPGTVAAQTRRPSSEGGAVTVWANLSLSSNPGNATVTIDGIFYGNTPLIRRTTAGQHFVLIEQNGYKPWAQKVELPAEGLRLDAQLEPK